jgi:PleD family two-component response regulator
LSGIASTRVFELSEVNNQTTVSYRYLEKRDVMASLTFLLNRRNLEPSMFAEMEKLKAAVEANSSQASLDSPVR